ncbi:YbaN family protein [Xanthobacter sp. TB0139]|uniref:YbaN family protein n=1 Tax=Xanthobacter sp. TB0139 TaxID=3459178 RepID=UPI004039677A
MSARHPPSTPAQPPRATLARDGGASARDEAANSPELKNRRRWHSALYRQVLFAAGIIFVMIGAIGLVVPMMPGTIFLILAAWCFARSSPRFETWLLTHRHLGPSVVRWRESGAIPPIAKMFAIGSFVVTLGSSWLLGAPNMVLGGLALLFAGLTIYIGSRPNL